MRLADEWQRKILEKFEKMRINPRPKGVRKIKGHPNRWRIRVGDYRIIYSIYDKEKNR